MQRRWTRVLQLAIAIAWMSAATVDAAPAGSEAVVVEPREQSEPTTEGLSKSMALRGSRALSLRLGAPSAAELARMRRPSRGIPLQVGIAREIPGVSDEAGLRSRLEWQALDDGAHVAGIVVTSGGASSLRAALRIGHLPDSA